MVITAFAGTVFVTDKGEIVYNFINKEPELQNKEYLQENPELKTRDIVSKAVAIKEFLE